MKQIDVALKTPYRKLKVCGRSIDEHRHRAKVCSENCKREISSKSNSIPIIQLSKEGKFIRKWESATEAASALNGQRTSIVFCLKGRIKTALGYKWRYAYDNN